MAIYSLSEIDALSRKATRGATYSWGIAEETGKALRWLSAYGFSGAEILSQHLVKVTEQKRSSQPTLISETSEVTIFGSDDGDVCSLTCGALLNDLGHLVAANKQLTFHDMSFPLLALPAAGRIAEAFNISVSYGIAETTIICNPNGIVLKDIPPPFGTFFLTSQADVTCSLSQNNAPNTDFPSPKSREIPTEVIKTLEKFAHSTYAPATEESRLRGAG